MDKRGEGLEGRGEESIWLVNFNAEADVSLCSWKISGLEMCHAMIIFVVFIVERLQPRFMLHVGCELHF